MAFKMKGFPKRKDYLEDKQNPTDSQKKRKHMENEKVNDAEDKIEFLYEDLNNASSPEEEAKIKASIKRARIDLKAKFGRNYGI
tara:strand:- start:323 stop:574 length:252 start_codon:yes stop_codon:yes gene_type:complete